MSQPVSDAIIEFHKEAVEFEFEQIEQSSNWIKQAIEAEEQQLKAINIIFCSDDYLHKINIDYLNHDTLTDVITFPYSDTHIEGDIYISIERIRENAHLYHTDFHTELHRVIIHGVLHLCGYGDKTDSEQQQMRAKEEEYLAKL